ncbi:hypothetical protein AVI48_15670 (plasmid) [Piscirickettsia salmonis]|nr:thioredoxin domain-containing protein [Piscirickettsia salmonis]ALA26657.1 DSBA oxidoreductase [Piscirickettsia salmonis]APS45870.1 hypothetical protein AVI48_15670 [Piscirickettsia salmonis]APS49247.1 hypothetical protein AVI49_16455 [Piscirickettsia salmonis]QGP24195.1 Protein-disulfide isomerase [Piscirickettsia salmonis]
MKRLTVLTSMIFFAANIYATPSTTDLNEAQVGQLATAYFKSHPEKMLEIIQSMQQALKEQQYNGVKNILIKNRDFLFGNELPSIGQAHASKALIFFYDYQCIYCHKQYPILKQLLKKDKDLKIVFIPLHLFGKASLYASKMGLYFNSIGQFSEFNTALEKANLIEGNLSKKGVNHIVSQLKADLAQAQKFIKSKTTSRIITKIDELQNQLGIQATPMMFTLPIQQKKLVVNDVHVVQGYTPIDRLQSIA